MQKAGLPDGCVQIVTGAGPTGAALVDAAPDKIMFTGSVATGKKIAAAAAKNLTSVVLELGGKDPMIVFADANLDLAAGAAVWGAFCNSGQSCSSVERLYVEESVAAELTRKIVEKTETLKQDTGDKETTSVGAMSSVRQIEIVEDHVEDFRAAGAKIETGGRRNPDLEGLFYEPTVITNVNNDMRGDAGRDVWPNASDSDIYNRRAKRSGSRMTVSFGLTASVWTRDLARGQRVAQQIESGSVCVNEVLYTHGIAQTPWGGFKNSGRGGLMAAKA